jgi:hypothetical protein
MPKRRAKLDHNLSLFHTADTTQSPAGDTRPAASAASAATGGPSTVHSIDYQLKVAVYDAYRMMAEVLAAPFRDLTITLEARSIHEEGITRWDVGFGLPTRLLEIKLKVNRADVLEWLERIAQTHDREAEFRLVYGRTSGALEGSVLRQLQERYGSSLQATAYRCAEMGTTTVVEARAGNVVRVRGRLRNFTGLDDEQFRELMTRACNGIAGSTRMYLSHNHSVRLWNVLYQPLQRRGHALLLINPVKE